MGSPATGAADGSKHPRPKHPRPAERWFRLRLGDLGRALFGLIAAALGVALAAAVLPDFGVRTWWGPLVVAVELAVVGALLRPLLVRLAAWTGWVGALLVGLFGQALIVWLTVFVSRGALDATFLSAFVASWIIAAVTTAAAWLGTAGTDDAVTARLLRTARRRPRTVPDPDVPGVVFIQTDGVPYPVLQWGVTSGTLPTLSRWVREGTHRMAEWRPTLPATTPASQMGILHGSTQGIPAFRWLDRPSGRVYVANRPADAAAIEAMHSDGRGLLADDGVSISNLFTGDAPTAYATMSAIRRTEETREARFAVSRFLASPEGLARGFSRSVSEIVRERFQASRARRRDVRPRVHRGWNFAVERAGVSGALRDLNTSLVAESMLAGRRAIYVDYVDYDAVAHHAGVTRPESLSALEGLDGVLAQLEKVADVAPRRYVFVVLSDHGQSQGEIFADRYGEDLSALVSRLADTQVVSAGANPEAAGHLQSLVVDATPEESVVTRALTSVSDRYTSKAYEGDDDVASAVSRAAAEFLVFGSGNLGLVYLSGEKRRLTLEEINARFPALLPGLTAHPGVGFVVTESTEHGPVVLGAGGQHHLRSGAVIGEDPLAPFGPHAAEFVHRVAQMPEAPDIMLNSLIDPMGEVAAFEGLVGCHGGLGGWQDRAMIVSPVHLPMPVEMVVGADALHRVLVGWLEILGHRRRLADQDTPVEQDKPARGQAAQPSPGT